MSGGDLAGRDHHLPGRRIEALEADLGQRRDLRRRADALRGRDAKRAQLAGLHQRQRGGEVAEHHLHMAAHDVVERRREALVGHMHELDAELAAHQLGEQVRRAAGAVRRIGQPLRPGLRIGGEIGERLHRQRRIDHQDERHAGDQRDRHQIPGRIIGQVLVDADIDRHRGRGADQDGVAVGRGARHVGRADHGGGAEPLLDHERLPQLLLEPVRQRARDRVGVAAGGIGQDDGDGSVGIGLRGRAMRAARSIAAQQHPAHHASDMLSSAVAVYCEPAMPACCTTLPQRAISDFTNACSSATVGRRHRQHAGLGDLRPTPPAWRAGSSAPHAAARRSGAASSPARRPSATTPRRSP